MYSYDVSELRALLRKLLTCALAPGVLQWFDEEVTSSDHRRLARAFVMMPRKTGRAELSLSLSEKGQIAAIREGLERRRWSTDLAGRSLLLISIPAQDRGMYISTVEALFANAEMNELIALYTALPLLPYAEEWRRRCSEGIRSNIAGVLDAIMLNSPYPSEQLEAPAWNQMVLKAMFTDKPFLGIIGLRKRANYELAKAISLFAHERWAAGRPVNPLYWYCVAAFLDHEIFPDIERLAVSVNASERKAAALVCRESIFPDAVRLRQENRFIRESIGSPELTWDSLASEISL